MAGLLDWVDPAREWWKSRPEVVRGLLSGAYSMATDQATREAAMARLPKPFDQSVTGEQMMNNALNAGPSGLLGKIVYHGSPHKFDKFDASKIGTGEGAQAYGHGVYLADSPGVAKSYQEMTPDATAPIRRTFMGKELQQGSPEYHAASLVQNSNKSIPSIRKEVAGWIDDWASKGRPMDASEVRGWQQTLDLLGSAKSRKDFGTLKHEGSLYKADLPDEWIPKMLDWDKPLSKQPKEVVDGFRQMLKDQKYLGPNDNGPRQFNSALKAWRMERAGMAEKDSGNLFWEAMRDAVGGADKAAEYFRNSGVPGIRYLDGGSRSAGKGSYNYVVFPGLEDQVKILERNGIPLSGLLGR